MAPTFQLSPEAAERLARGEFLTLVMAHSYATNSRDGWPSQEEREQRVFALVSPRPLAPEVFADVAAQGSHSRLELMANRKYRARSRVSRRRLPGGKSESVHVFELEDSLHLGTDPLSGAQRVAIFSVGIAYTLPRLSGRRKRRDSAAGREIKIFRKMKWIEPPKGGQWEAQRRLKDRIENAGGGQQDSWPRALRAVEQGLKWAFPDAACMRLPQPPAELLEIWRQPGGLMACGAYLLARAENRALADAVSSSNRGKSGKKSAGNKSRL